MPMQQAQQGLDYMDTGLWNFLWTPYRSDSTCVVQDCGEKFEGDKRPNGDTVVSQRKNSGTAYRVYHTQW